MTQLYVGNLSADGDEKAIRALFSKYGVVREVLMKNGYAFVEYEDSYSAEEAMRALNGELSLSILPPLSPPFSLLLSVSMYILCK